MKNSNLNLLLVIISLKLVVALGVGITLEDIYQDPRFKNSVAYDARVISTEETLRNMEVLLMVIPSYKNEVSYEMVSGLSGLSNDIDPNQLRGLAKDWHRNDIFVMMKEELRSLINIAYPNTEGFCNEDNIISIYNIHDKFSILSSPQKNKPYGPNLMNYIKENKLKLISYCGDLLSEKIASLPKDQANSMNELTKFVFPFGIQNTESFLNFDNKSSQFINGLKQYVKSTMTRNSEKEFNEKYSSIVKVCKDFLNTSGPINFLMWSFWNDRSLANYVLDNQFLTKTAMEIKICFNIEGKELYDKVKTSAGYGFIGTIEKFFSPKSKQ